MSAFTVIKCDHAGREELRYYGTLSERGESWVCVRAVFDFPDRELGYVTLKRGDLFVEWFYRDRWYNVFRIHDRDTHALKGFYCNLARPAQIETHSVRQDDLALDVFVYPDGRTLLLDQEAYDALPLAAAERVEIAHALHELERLIAARAAPFDVLA